MFAVYRSWNDLELGVPAAPETYDAFTSPASAAVGAAGYEGNQTTWEASDLLLGWFAENPQLLQLERDSLVVLDLGCGRPLLTLQLARLRCAHNLSTICVLQDLDYYPLSLLDAAELRDDPLLDVRFLCCDWTALAQQLAAARSTAALALQLNLLVSSETLYRSENFPELTAIFRAALAQHGARAVLAQKLFYFGVGGGLLNYRFFLEEAAPDLLIDLLKVYDNTKNSSIGVCSIALASR